MVLTVKGVWRTNGTNKPKESTQGGVGELTVCELWYGMVLVLPPQVSLKLSLHLTVNIWRSRRLCVIRSGLCNTELHPITHHSFIPTTTSLYGGTIKHRWCT
jgi:hypothetical protein